MTEHNKRWNEETSMRRCRETEQIINGSVGQNKIMLLYIKDDLDIFSVLWKCRKDKDVQEEAVEIELSKVDYISIQ